MIAKAVLLLIAAALCEAQTGGGGNARAGNSPISSPPMPRLIALLGGATIASVDLNDGRVTTRLLADKGSWNSGWSIGHEIDSDTLYVALVGKNTSSTRILAVSARTLAASDIMTVRDGTPYGWLRVGARTGRLYAVATTGFRGVVIDPVKRTIAARFDGGRAPQRYQEVFWFQINSDETRIFVSYHGSATGIDWATIRGDSLFVCSNKDTTQGLACMSAHGAVAPYGGGVIAATGAALVQIASDGQLQRTLPTGLSSRNHFMEFALDAGAGLSYNIGSCLTDGGLATTNVDARAGTTLAVNAAVCGEQISVSSGGDWLAVAAGNIIQLLDARTGQVIRRVEMPAVVVDVLFVGR